MHRLAICREHSPCYAHWRAWLENKGIKVYIKAGWLLRDMSLAERAEYSAIKDPTETEPTNGDNTGTA